MEKKPDFYRYLAILEYTEDGVHVTFPDLPGCVTFGEDEATAIAAAREALALHLWGMEEDGEALPIPSSLRALSRERRAANETYFLVEAFMPAIREKMANRYVKKTLSIPAWLNAQAEHCGINFSRTLQNALKAELKIA